MNKLILLLQLFVSVNVSAQNLPEVAAGKIERMESFSSQFVAPRNIDIWLPEGYNTNNKYSVVYMHDGQMLFDSTQTWNKKEWLADEIFGRLMAEKKIETCIIVAIWNTPDRITEYFPNKIFENLEPELQKSILEKYGNGKKITSDNYLKFIVSELKPYIDSHYSTKTEKENTVIMGSSMGGLISAYAISEYPGIFGGAACLSTAWFSFVEPNYAIPMAAFKYFEKNFSLPSDHKIYFDYGTGESDKNYELTQSFVDLIARGKGYTESNYKSMVFEKAVHDEVAWSRRLDIPLVFLLGH
ncbi:MAG TPA: alpha/beta hydrolase-fold protein [Draconibacterium sp.]|nr:alpha/beta hydrolase-fold protein [Draconibacterium sp.]